MITIQCHTNLDIHSSEEWPTSVPARPMIDDYILSKRVWGSDNSGVARRLSLVVTKITLYENYLDVELGLPPTIYTIIGFTRYYKHLTNNAIS